MTTQDHNPDETSRVDPQDREEVAMRHVEETLIDDYASERSPEQVAQAVTEAAQQYADAPVRNFVPNLVERDVREQLDDEQ